MKKVFEIFYLFVVIATMFCACCKETPEEYYPITAEDKKWNQYTQKQKLTFISNTLAKDSFWVDVGSITTYTYGPVEKCHGAPHQVMENWGAQLTRFNNPSIAGGISFRSLVKSQTQIGIGWKTTISKTFNSDALPSSITLNGFTYDDVYFAESDSNKVAQSEVYKVYYSKSFGFVRYDEKGGKFWELVR